MTVLVRTSGKAYTRYEHPSSRNNPQNTLRKLEGLKALQQYCTVESLDRFGFLALAFLHISLCHSIKPSVYVCQQNGLKALVSSTGWVAGLLFLAIASLEKAPSSGKLFVKAFSLGHERENSLQR